MAKEQKATVDAIRKNAGKARQRSSIAFPYMDLNSAIELAEAIHNHVGTGDCDDDQLAVWSEQSVKSSTFRVQVYAARTFGVLEGESGKHRLTDLGRAIVDSNRAREARVRAFLNVALYKEVYEHYKGGVLPPAAALEKDLVNMGVSEKQKDRARQVMERSAEQAGFSEHGKNRLVAPGVVQGEQKQEKEKKGRGGGGGDDEPPRHPLVEGLFQSLPSADQTWTLEEAADWLQAAAYNLRMAYKFKGTIAVTATPPGASEKP